jgi:hypothetical protein
MKRFRVEVPSGEGYIVDGTELRRKILWSTWDAFDSREEAAAEISRLGPCGYPCYGMTPRIVDGALPCLPPSIEYVPYKVIWGLG